MEPKQVVAAAKKFRRRWERKLVGDGVRVGIAVCATFSGEENSNGVRGACDSASSEYGAFVVDLNANNLDSPGDVGEVLAHEYGHIILAPYSEIAKVLQESIGNTANGRATLELLRQAGEKVACRLAKTFKNLGVK